MKTKLLYALVAGKGDIYFEQFLISSYSARYWNPEATIVLVTDSKTYEMCIGNEKAQKYADEIVIIPVEDHWSGHRRSRELKTSLRNYVQGDYLYIDTDTVVCGSLDELDSWSIQIGAVFDAHHSFSPNVHFVSSALDSLGIMAQIGDPYFNSGVMYVKDTDDTRAFYKEWHDTYIESERNGFGFDQASLFATNQKLQLIQSIDGIYNCQLFSGGIPWLGDAKIIHTFNNIGASGHGNPIPEQKYEPNASPAFYRPADTNFLLKIKQQGCLLEEDKEIIKTAKRQFYGEYQLYFGKEMEYHHSVLHHIFHDSPKMFHLVEFIAKIVRKVNTFIKS